MKTALVTAMLACIGFVATAAAHHSYAMFDSTRKVTVKGSVSDWQWTNPHSQLYVMVDDLDGKPLAPPGVSKARVPRSCAANSTYAATGSRSATR
jgi:hypothetical protein